MAKKKSTSTKSVGISVLGGSKADMRKWEVESAMSTLKRADEIRKDAKLMNEVKSYAKEQVQMLSKMIGGRTTPMSKTRK
jgi:hypothetical protein